MPSKRKKPKKKDALSNDDQLWCTEDVNIDDEGNLRIYNTYLCAAVAAAVARARAAGNNLKIVCETGGGTDREQNPQCTC
jgi:hypothetical protein